MELIPYTFQADKESLESFRKLKIKNRTSVNHEIRESMRATLENGVNVSMVKDGITTEYSGKYMICTYSKEYKSLTHKETGYTQLLFKGTEISKYENPGIDEFCAMQEYVINRIAKS